MPEAVRSRCARAKVYPERPDKAPVVLVIMEIFGMTPWIRATTDQLAADGFIAIAPDFLSAAKGRRTGRKDVILWIEARGSVIMNVKPLLRW